MPFSASVHICIALKNIQFQLSHRRVCNLSDPEATSGEQFQNHMLWVRGFTGFNVDGMQIHLKKNTQFPKKKY